MSPVLCLSAENGPEQGWRGDNRGVPGVLPEGKVTFSSALGLGHLGTSVPSIALLAEQAEGRASRGKTGALLWELYLCQHSCAGEESGAWKLPVIPEALVPQSWVRAAMRLNPGLREAAWIAVPLTSCILPTG